MDTAIKVGAVVSSLSGFAALATLTGGAITWARFRRAHLPADQVVAAMPTGELVTVGAVALTTFALASLVAVLAIYLLDSEGRSGARNQYGVTGLAVAGVIFAVVSSDPQTWTLFAAIAVTLVAGPFVYLIALKSWRRSPGRIPRGVVATLTTGAAAALVALVLWLLTGEWWVAVMTVLTAALAGLGLQVAHRTHTQFRWYGVGVFLAIVVYGAFLSTLRTHSEVQLQPVAVARTAAAGGGGLAGFYVTDTSEHVLLGYVDRCERGSDLRLVPTNRSQRGRLVKLRRSSVEAMSVGPRASLLTAEKRAPQLLAELYARLGSSSAVQAAASDRCAAEGIVDLAERVTTPVTPKDAEELARRHRPHLMFDSQERWRPLRIDPLMAERTPAGLPRHRICVKSKKGRSVTQTGCEPLVGVEDLSDATEPDRIIDFDGKRLGGGEYRAVSLAACPGRQPKVLQDCDRGPDTAIYYNVTQANGRFYVDYWWYLRYNRFAGQGLDDVCGQRVKRRAIGCFDHEGDWEGVTVVTKKGDRERLASVGLAAHSGIFRFSASELELTEAGRPVIYSAQGSHASYPHACPSRCRQLARVLGTQLPETNTDGRLAWAGNDDGGALTPLPGVWRKFKGRWGSPECSFGAGRCEFELGPQSPANQLRYRRPWCHTGATGKLECDGVPPAAGDAAPPAATAKAG